VYLYRWRLGRLLGNRFLLLTHVGRRTGLRRQTVLEVMEYRRDGPEAVVMSGFGRNSDWLRNIEATPGPEVVIGSQYFIASHRFLGEKEAMEAVRSYERRNRFVAPIVRWALSRLLGWRYRASDDDCQRLVRQLPLIAFRPQRGDSLNFRLPSVPSTRAVTKEMIFSSLSTMDRNSVVATSFYSEECYGRDKSRPLLTQFGQASRPVRKPITS
jgi:deazaflavin-dependent oxidoreductase (nitroreductase family)